ncbi:MAG: nucleotidyltransferase family protein [Kiloniellales bacterium]
MPKRAMLLAAGRGERMRPITDSLPKPLVEVCGKAMLDHALDRLEAAGVQEVVINLCHLGAMIEAHLAGRTRPRIVFSPEETMLETGGGVRRALPLLGAEAFIVANADMLWLDGRTPALQRLAAMWDDAHMDALLLLHPTAYALGYYGAGDFIMDPLGQLRRRGEREIAPFVFAGIQILHPRLFAGVPEGRFSLNTIYDKAQEAGRLWGLRHDGDWFHIGTPQALSEAEEALRHLHTVAVQR